jgi:mxaJ protein
MRTVAVAVVLASACLLWPCAALAQEPQRELLVCADPSNLPYSNEREEGFENRIASLIAQELQATLHYTWNMQRRSFLRRTLHAGECDVVIGVPVGLRGVLATRPYYASSYVFISQRERHLQRLDFDDPALPRLKIGLQAIGADGANTPPANSLATRGLVHNVVGFSMWAEEDVESPPERIIDAVVAGEIDTAIVWGPFAGYFGKRHGDRLEVHAVTSDARLPSQAFTFEIALGVRKGETALRDELQAVLDRRQQDIQAILDEYAVPRIAATPAQPLRAAQASQ